MSADVSFRVGPADVCSCVNGGFTSSPTDRQIWTWAICVWNVVKTDQFKDHNMRQIPVSDVTDHFVKLSSDKSIAKRAAGQQTVTSATMNYWKLGESVMSVDHGGVMAQTDVLYPAVSSWELHQTPSLPPTQALRSTARGRESCSSKLCLFLGYEKLFIQHSKQHVWCAVCTSFHMSSVCSDFHKHAPYNQKIFVLTNSSSPQNIKFSLISQLRRPAFCHF